MLSLFNPVILINNLWKNRELIRQLIKRDILSRFKGSKLGILWLFLNPLIMLAIYTFVFSVVFNARWGTGSGNKIEFAMLLFCGITAFSLFSEVVIQSPRLILNNSNYVKKVVFPLEILPIVIMGSAIIQLFINIVILILGLVVFLGIFNWTIIFLPIVLLPIILLSTGIGWFLASFGVFFRDIGHILTLAVQALMFLSPIFYPVSSIPVEYRGFFYVNPISYVVEDMRRIMVWGEMPNMEWLAFGTLIGGLIAISGYAWFQKTRGGFADVL